MIQINLVVGIAGMLCILVAFILDEFDRRFNKDTCFYNILNIIGAGSLMYYGFTLRGWPFVILNAIWVVAAGVKLVRIIIKN